MIKNAKNPSHYGAAAAFIDKKLAVGQVSFTLSELMWEKGLSRTAAKNQLRRLRHRVVPVSRRHPFFVILGAEHVAMGTPPISWWLDDYFKWLKHPYYLALQSAAAAYGSLPHALQTTQIMTDIPRRDVVVGRVRVQFFVKRGIQETPTQPLANAYAPFSVSTPEATALDLVRYAPRIGGLERVIETLTPLLTLMRIPELKRALKTQSETSAIQRLGYLMERAGHKKLAEVLHVELSSYVPWIPLVPTKASVKNAPAIKRWRLLDNLRGSNR